MPCGTGEQSLKRLDLRAISFGYSGLNFDKGMPGALSAAAITLFCWLSRADVFRRDAPDG
jgi:hypothetical protein